MPFKITEGVHVLEMLPNKNGDWCSLFTWDIMPGRTYLMTCVLHEGDQKVWVLDTLARRLLFALITEGLDTVIPNSIRAPICSGNKLDIPIGVSNFYSAYKVELTVVKQAYKHGDFFYIAKMRLLLKEGDQVYSEMNLVEHIKKAGGVYNG